MNLLQRVSTRAERGRPAKGLVLNLDSLRGSLLSSPLPDRETVENDFGGYIERVYKANGPVFAVIRARQMVFSQGRFAWRDQANDTLSWTSALNIFRRPWPGGITPHLLSRMEVDVSLAGNAYVTRTDDTGRFGPEATGPGSRLVRMRPDWVTIVIHSPSRNPWGLDAKVVGYWYEPHGPGVLTSAAGTGAGAIFLTTDQVAHYMIHPDPGARFRGMSWLTPVLDEVQADKSATRHKRKFFDNGATLNVVVGFDKEVTPAAFDHFVAKFKEQHRGVENAYETLFLGGGADPKVVSADMQQMDFRTLSGAAETRIAAAGGGHPVVVGLSEGLQGSSLNAGNFSQVRRLFVDGTLEWLWPSAEACLETLAPPPSQELSLAVDTRHINFLRADRKDVADIQRIQSIALRQLLDAGYDPDAAVRMLMTDDPRELLAKHSGRFSVQLQQTGNGGGGE